jgi:hypothetical protein
MKNLFFSRLDPDNLRKTIIYSVIAVPLIIISLVLGIDKNGWATFMFFFGLAFFFYALFRPWGNAKYYGIMCIIIIIILTLCLTVGSGILSKMQLKYNWDKDYGDLIGFIGFEGVIVGIIGIFRFRKSD